MDFNEEHLHEQILLLGVQAYLAGLTFALAASPCSTPVLATLLGYVAASKVLTPVSNQCFFLM